MNRRYRRRKINKEISFDLYRRKWGLSDYRFYIRDSHGKHYRDSLNMLFIMHKDVDHYYARTLTQLVSLKTVLKNIRKTKRIEIWWANKERQSFESVEEFKEHLLIRKLAGI